MHKQRHQSDRAAAPAATVDEDIAALADRVGGFIRDLLEQRRTHQLIASVQHFWCIAFAVDQPQLVIADRA
ncbi:hypothetical protein D3C76_1384270 [compost metagenome]